MGLGSMSCRRFRWGLPMRPQALKGTGSLPFCQVGGYAARVAAEGSKNVAPQGGCGP